MTGGSPRLESGGRIRRGKPLEFTFNGRAYRGYAGDTLASALLANGVRLSARSFKYHRPRGIMGAGTEEPSCLVELLGDDASGNQPATTVPLRQGLEARSVNCWPSPGFDLMAVNQLFARLLPAGFYYKTFMWPDWRLFEPSIRRAAGLAAPPDGRIPERHFETRHWHGDMLVVGAGPCGLLAALTASRSGARVMLVDDAPAAGGLLNSAERAVDGAPGHEWAAAAAAELAANPEVTHLQNSTAWAYREDNLVLAVERDPAPAHVFQRGWKARARQVVLATGAIERPLVFPDNDRPGVMLAGAVRRYVNEFAVLPGREAVVFTNNSGAYGAARAMAARGIAVAGIVDSRPPDAIGPEAEGLDIPVHAGHQVCAVHGRRRVRGVTVRPEAGGGTRIACDLLAVSGGWNPAVHLFSQARGTLDYDEGLAAFVPGKAAQAVACVGAAAGWMDLAPALKRTASTVGKLLSGLGFKPRAGPPPKTDPAPSYGIVPLWHVDGMRPGQKAFVDVQNDVTVDDVGLAMREGFEAVEHVKRYTTAGMGVDQGKTGNINVIGAMARISGRPPADIGTTTFRSPYAPVEFGAVAGQRAGPVVLPYRHTPITEWNKAKGAVMYEAGARWRRPGFFPEPGGTMQDAINAEAGAVRSGVGVYDGSPLGKFDIAGRDAEAFIELLYTNDFATLETGMGRYWLMLTEDGMILDDGVTFKLAGNHYLMSSSTGNADLVHRHMEHILQAECPGWQVWITPVTAQWSNATVCGPKARELMRALGTSTDLDPAAFPFMALREAEVAGIPSRICRVSFTGEVSYEVNVRSRDALALWEAVMEAGKPLGILPVGSETSHVLRVEKGFLSLGHEVDGTADPYDLGMGWIMSRAKTHSIGRRSVDIRRKPGLPRRELVGLVPDSGGALVSEGAPVTPRGGRVASEGFVSACVWSVVNEKPVALGMLRNGRARIGETVFIRDRESVVEARVAEPCFHDPEGERLRG